MWAEGYAKGELTAHVYPDTVEALDIWRSGGAAVHIYFSGSVQAQQLWFAHTPYGDLRSRLTYYFDTANAGPKEAVDSYRTIAAALSLPPHGILFASDSPTELDAARLAGWKTALVLRPEEPPRPAPAGRGHARRHPDLLSLAREQAP
ncbi:acireductone synthase [Streptomyces sp. NBC_00576]|uniref:acireductone synthase n=1 Tax=Streptomyces sp. NBC_00576 TaxID=2903665 RepID=UPI003FCCBB4D